MNNSSHANSRIVTIFRSNTFVQNSQAGQTAVNKDGSKGDEGLQDWMNQSSRNVGPYLQSNTARIIGSGLTQVETALLMPHMINMEPGDREFRKTVFDFFNSLTTKIPPTTGKTLEIGLTVDNSKAISEKNMPLNVEDYIRYRHAKEHPWVAKSKEEADGNTLKTFYIYDADTDLKERSDKVVLQDKADAIWATIKNQPQKVSMLLTLMGKDERDYTGRNVENKRINDLHEIVKTQASAFVTAYEDDRFEARYWLAAMIKANVVDLVGDSYISKSNGKLLARTLPAMLVFLEDERQTDVVTFLKGATQDILRKPKKAVK
jgi:hypothetical protein